MDQPLARYLPCGDEETTGDVRAAPQLPEARRRPPSLCWPWFCRFPSFHPPSGAPQNLWLASAVV